MVLIYDNTMVASRAGYDTRTATGINRLNLGVSWSSLANTRGEINYDEVVVDRTLSPCD